MRSAAEYLGRLSAMSYNRRVAAVMSDFFHKSQLLDARAWRIVRGTVEGVLVVVCAVLLWLAILGAPREFDLLPQKMVHADGAAFSVPFKPPRPWRLPSDSLSDASRSALALFEDGRLLGPAHVSHADIRGLGAGRYSHWSNYILFSTSDNSDPRTNGRRYRAVGRVLLAPSVAVLPFLLLLAWVAASSRNFLRSREALGLARCPPGDLGGVGYRMCCLAGVDAGR